MGPDGIVFLPPHLNQYFRLFQRVENFSIQQLTETADLLVDLYPDKEDRIKFLVTPQGELGGKSPHDAIMQDPPYGLRDVVRLLGRMEEGIPT